MVARGAVTEWIWRKIIRVRLCVKMNGHANTLREKKKKKSANETQGEHDGAWHIV